MKLKYNINDTVFYWDALNDKICYGRIIAIEYEVCDPFNFVNYSIRNVYFNPDDDGYELEVGGLDIFKDEKEIYEFLKERSYDRNSCDQIRCMTEKEFSDFFDEQHGTANENLTFAAYDASTHEYIIKNIEEFGK